MKLLDKTTIEIFKLIPLKARLFIYFFLKHRKVISFSNPKTYTEKLQLRKLNMLPEYSELSDKYAVRRVVEQKLGGDYLIPLIGYFSSFSDVNFSELPKAFVIKTNFGSGDEHIEIVKDKSTINYDKLRKKFDRAMVSRYKGTILGETQYDLIPKKIIIEELIDNNGLDVEDFKFHIFNGSEGFLQVDFDRFSNHKRNLYSLDFERLDYDLLYSGGDYDLPSLQELNKLKKAAVRLAEGFDYVRVDLYLVNGKVLFGEMTFTPGSGFESFSDFKADLYYGNLWQQSLLTS